MANYDNDGSNENKLIDDAIKEINRDGSLPQETKLNLIKKFQNLKKQKLNILITGATGSGKSSTINAMFNADVAKVGIGADPETMDIKKFELSNMTLWDSPGLGDGKEADERHARNITSKLLEVDKTGNALIDVVLVILDGSSRDLGTPCDLINNVIIPALGENRENRLLVAINKCDVALSGHYWDKEKNVPEPRLIQFMDDKVESIHRRVLEATSVDIKPIYYSAGYTDEYIKSHPYNLAELLYYLVKMTPTKKRLVLPNNISPDPKMWVNSPRLETYRKGIIEALTETISDTISAGADMIGDLGNAIAGDTGEKIGRVIGSVGGAIVGCAKAIYRGIFSGW